MSALVKICEACGYESDPAAVICQCGQPIIHILPTPKLIPEENSTPSGSEVCQSGTSNGEKTCAKCGTRHPSHRLSCDCGERLPSAPGQLTTLPADQDSVDVSSCTMIEQKPAGELFLCFANQKISLRDGDVLGRKGTVAASDFAVIREVSREHARILLLEDGWHIVALSANITEVDGKVLERGKPHPLRGNHRVRLSSKCEIRLETT